MNGFQLDLGNIWPCGYWSPERIHSGIHLLSKSIGEPPRDTRTERVPYSSVTYHFDDICGIGYGERTLKYQYDLICKSHETAQRCYREMEKLLHFQGTRPLRDAMYPGYFFEVYDPVISMEHPQNQVYTFSITFSANPAMLPNSICSENLARLRDSKFPDVDGSGTVTAADAALILSAALNIAIGQASGLTPAQEDLADADRDGSITTADALLVQDYICATNSGQFPNNASGWYDYLQRHFRLEEAVY